MVSPALCCKIKCVSFMLTSIAVNVILAVSFKQTVESAFILDRSSMLPIL